MEEGDYFAIETFGSTGRGMVVEQGECSHYARIWNPPNVHLRYVNLYQIYPMSGIYPGQV
jgi:methionine aminopeptidase